MEEILLQHLGLTKEEFDKGLNDFFISKQSKNIDTMLNLLADTGMGGIPKGKITALTGTSNYGSIYHEYVLHLISNYQIENRNKKLNDLEI
jgi:hypothetical protein